MLLAARCVQHSTGLAFLGLRWFWQAVSCEQVSASHLCQQPERRRMNMQDDAAGTAPASIIILMELRLTTMALSLMNMAVGYGVGICRQQQQAWVERLSNPQSTAVWNTIVRAASQGC